MAGYSFVTVVIVAVNLIFVRNQKYTLSPSGSGAKLNGSTALFCSDTAKLECQGVRVPVLLEWFINGTSIGSYSFRETDIENYPLNIPLMFTNSLMAEVIAGSRIDSFMANVTSKLQGKIVDFNELSIQCGSDIIFSNSLQVLERGRESPQMVKIVGMVVEGGFAFSVEWNVSDMECLRSNYTFVVELQNETGHALMQKFVTCSRNCNTSIPVAQPDIKYIIQVAAADNQKNPILSTASTSQLLDLFSDNVTKPNITFSPCYTSVMCLSLVAGRCDISIFQEGNTITRNNGSTNTSIDLMGIKRNTQYSYRAIVFIGIQYVLEDNLTTTEYDARWTPAAIVGFALGSFCGFTSFALLLVNIYLLYNVANKSEKRMGGIVCAVLTAIGLLILLIIFIIIIAVVESQSNTCEDSWQSARLGLIWVFFVLSILDLIPALTGAIFLPCLKSQGDTQSTQKLSSVQTTIETHHVTSLAVDDMGMSEAEKSQVQGHRKIGEGKKDATLRVRDEITGAVKEMQEASTNVYSTTQHGNSTQAKLSQIGSQISSNTYSILNRAKNAVKPQDSSEYSVLQHKQGKSTKPVSSVAVTGSTSSDVPGGTTGQYGQLNTESVSSHDNKHEEAKNTDASVTDNDGQKLVNGSKSATESTV